ncbi:MAG: hypothetical protein ACLFVP_05295 [Candidatus Bathyarchaeia archaeon]
MTTEEESKEKAECTIAKMINCPNLIATGHSGNIVYSVFMAPKEKRWWLEYPQTLNDERGEEKYKVKVIEELSYPLEPPNKEEIYDSPPCGADCEGCKLKERYSCGGCPAIKK